MIAKALQVTLNQQGGRSVSVFLGDGVRPELDGRKSALAMSSATPSYIFPSVYSKTPEERSKDIQRMAFVSAELARAGAAVITAPSTAKEAARSALKETVLQSAGPGGNFFTIHVSTPLEQCESSDRSGLFAAARRGEFKGVAGVDEAFEAPARADLTVNLAEESVSEAVTSEYT